MSCSGPSYSLHRMPHKCVMRRDQDRWEIVQVAHLLQPHDAWWQALGTAEWDLMDYAVFAGTLIAHVSTRLRMYDINNMSPQQLHSHRLCKHVQMRLLCTVDTPIVY